MARKSSKSLFTFASRAQKAATEQVASVGWLKVLKTFSVICVAVAICVGFWFLDRYRRQVAPAEESIAPLKLVEPPAWLNNELKVRIARTAQPKGTTLALDENSAAIVTGRLKSLAWLTNVKVETNTKGVLIQAEYREPVAMIELRGTKFYISKDMVILDYLPMDTLPIVQLTGMETSAGPIVGQEWRRDDAVAAMEILDKLRGMDGDIRRQGDAPLLREIKSIDVSNFDGRRDAKKAHIVLKAADGTEILWGAKLGMAARHMEANDHEKLAMLYEFYLQPKVAGNKPTLQGRVKYVELRIPRDSIPRPTVPLSAVPN